METETLMTIGFSLAIGLCIGGFAGAAIQMHDDHLQAVSRGHAKYSIGANGYPTFTWNDNLPQQGTTK